MRGTETITVIPQVKVDRLRNPSGAAPAEYPVAGCLVWPRASQEEGKGWIGIEGWGVKAPAGSDIPRTARVRLRGDEYEVDGQPQDFGRRGVLVMLTKVG